MAVATELGAVKPADSSLGAAIPADSLKKRYIFKVISSLVGLVSNVVVQAIAPRSLGPQAFGNFYFLTNFFDQVLEMADGKSSVGLLVKTSLRPQESGLVVFYLYFSILVSLLVFAGVGAIFALGLDQVIWPGQMGQFIVLAALWSVLVWLHGVLQNLCDAHGFTREAEWVRIQQKVLSVGILCAMFFMGSITLETFFYYYIFLLIYLLVGFAAILMWKGRWPSLQSWLLPWAQVKAYAREYFVYASPLFVYVAAEAIVAVLDRWLLQRFSGSAEQGYFGFAYQMGYISILFVGAISPLIQREFSVAHAGKNYLHMAYLFQRYMPMLFSISAFFTGFIAFQSDKLIRLFAGHEFNASLFVITTMTFYSIYFTFSRVTSAVFYATGETRLFRNLGLAVHGAGLVLSWFMIAPRGLGGLELGAQGLAVKMLVVQAILVNLQVWFSSRLLRIPFREYFNHQVLTLIGFLSLGFIATQFIDKIVIRRPDLELFEFLIAGVLYCGLVAGIVYILPSIFGVLRSDVVEVFHRFQRVFRIKPEVSAPTIPLRHLSREVESFEPSPSIPLRIVIMGSQNSMHAVRWANAMVARGHDVHFITMHAKGDEQFDRRVFVHELKFRAPFGYFLNVPNTKNLLLRIAPDVIHVHYASGYGTLTSLSTDRPFVLSTWGDDIFSIPKRSLIYRYLVRRALKQTFLITSASQSLGEATRREVKGSKPIYLVPYSVDTEEFSPRLNQKKSGTFRIGLVKSLEWAYGVDVLIRAFALVNERAKNERLDQKLELILVGKGSQRPLLESMAKSLGVGEQTQFRGAVSQEKMPRILGELDLFVAPSRSESFEVILVEALACGVPIIGTRAGGVHEVIEDGITGILIENEKIEDLAEAIWRFVVDDRLRQEFGAAGRLKALSEFNWNANVEGMERLYYQCREGKLT